jgi:hypothetical protein
MLPFLLRQLDEWVGWLAEPPRPFVVFVGLVVLAGLVPVWCGLPIATCVVLAVVACYYRRR